MKDVELGVPCPTCNAARENRCTSKGRVTPWGKSPNGTYPLGKYHKQRSYLALTGLEGKR